MGESLVPKPEQSSENIGTVVLFPKKLCKFGRVVWAIWPDDPVANLAKRALCTKRHASFLIDGKRKPNARAVHAVNSEMLE